MQYECSTHAVRMPAASDGHDLAVTRDWREQITRLTVPGVISIPSCAVHARRPQGLRQCLAAHPHTALHYGSAVCPCPASCPAPRPPRTEALAQSSLRPVQHVAVELHHSKDCAHQGQHHNMGPGATSSTLQQARACSDQMPKCTDAKVLSAYTAQHPHFSHLAV